MRRAPHPISHLRKQYTQPGRTRRNSPGRAGVSLHATGHAQPSWAPRGHLRGVREAVAAPARQGGEKGRGKARDGLPRRAEGRAGSGPLIRACAQGVDAPRPFWGLRTAWPSWPARFLRSLTGKRGEKPKRSPGVPGDSLGGPNAPVALPLGAPEPPETFPAKPPGQPNRMCTH